MVVYGEDPLHLLFAVLKSVDLSIQRFDGGQHHFAPESSTGGKVETAVNGNLVVLPANGLQRIRRENHLYCQG